MPTLPKWMNDAMEGLLKSRFRAVIATHIEDLSSSVRRIKFQGDFESLAFEPGYAVGFRVSETAFRNYTPYTFNTTEGNCEILFHIHGNGPGSALIGGMNEGDELRMFAPRGRTVYRRHTAHHVVIGDETSLGLAMSIRAEAEKHGHSYNGVFELDEAAVLEDLELYGHTISKETFNKTGLIRQYIYQQQQDANINLDNTGFYITGSADTMRMARTELKQMNVPARNVFSQAYWAEGKTGL